MGSALLRWLLLRSHQYFIIKIKKNLRLINKEQKIFKLRQFVRHSAFYLKIEGLLPPHSAWGLLRNPAACEQRE